MTQTPELSNKQLAEAEALGGFDPRDFLGIDPRFTNRHYSDKGGHKARSIVNDPKHLEHWKKEGRKQP